MKTYLQLHIKFCKNSFGAYFLKDSPKWLKIGSTFFAIITNVSNISKQPKLLHSQLTSLKPKGELLSIKLIIEVIPRKNSSSSENSPHLLWPSMKLKISHLSCKPLVFGYVFFVSFNNGCFDRWQTFLKEIYQGK